MYAQLGNIIFEGIKSFSSFSSSSEETYAQHERINGKPNLQHTGSGLEQVNITIRFHASFCVPSNEVAALKRAKETQEVLPYIRGNGEYDKDYVITSLSETPDFVANDGTILSVVISLGLLEFKSDDKLYQQQLAARRTAYAVGNTRIATVPQVQPPTVTQETAADIGSVGQQGAMVDSFVAQYEDNVTQRSYLATRMQDSFSKMDKSIQRVNDRIAQVEELGKYNNIIDVANNVKAVIDRFQFPITDIAGLKKNNTDLQAVLRVFKRTSGPLLNSVAIRTA